MKYVRNEWMKLWSKKSTWIMLILLAAVIIGYNAIDKSFEVKNNTKETWREDVQSEIEMYQAWLEDGDEALAGEIALLQYRLDNNIPITSAFSDSVKFGTDMLMLVTIFAVVVAAGIVSSEFGTGTIKMLLTRPVARWKILLSKLVTVLLFGFVLFGFAVALSSLLGLVLYGTTSSVELQFVDGAIQEISPWSAMLEHTLLSFGDFFMSIIIAFLIGSLFKSSSLAVGITIVLMTMGSLIVMLLSRFDFVKYIWLTHTDLTQHAAGGQPFVEGTTLGFSIVVLVVYAIIFLAITFITFQKRDVTA